LTFGEKMKIRQWFDGTNYYRIEQLAQENGKSYCRFIAGFGFDGIHPAFGQYHWINNTEIE
jgi:hypothetical protein